MTIMLFIATMTISAQESIEWESKFYVDEFEEPTDVGYDVIMLTGKFSNTATVNSDLTVRIISSNDSFSIDLYEYNRGPAASLSYETKFGSFKIKQGDEVYTIDAMASKNGGIYVWKFKNTKKTVVAKNYALLHQILTEGGPIMISINENDFDSGKSKYIVKTNIAPLPGTN